MTSQRVREILKTPTESARLASRPGIKEKKLRDFPPHIFVRGQDLLAFHKGLRNDRL